MVADELSRWAAAQHTSIRQSSINQTMEASLITGDVYNETVIEYCLSDKIKV